MAQGSINVNVGGIQYEEPSATYKRVVLKSNLSFKSQVEGSSNANSLFIIKWDFDLGGQTVNIPSNCILQFEGGVLRNGTVNLNNTRIWPCYDALTIGDVTITGTPLGGDGELIYKEYKSQTVRVGNTAFEMFIVPIIDLWNAYLAYGHLTLKYGFTTFDVYISDSPIPSPSNMQPLQSWGPYFTVDSFKTPWTFNSTEIEGLVHMSKGEDCLYFAKKSNSKVLPRNLRIVY